MKRYCCCAIALTALFLATNELQAQRTLVFEPANRVSVSVSTNVSYNSSTGLYTYSYAITSASSSQQEVWYFALELDSQVMPQISNAAAPQGWVFRVHDSRTILSWAAVEVPPPPPDFVDDGNVIPSPFQIKPGETLTGFSFRSPSPPDTAKFYAQGFTKLPVVSGDISDEQIPDWTEDSFTGTTIGPVGTHSPQGDAFLLLIDADSISKETAPTNFSEADINLPTANIGYRSQLTYFAGNVGAEITLRTGQVGDEAWFALNAVPDTWTSAGPTSDGLRNFIQAGPGLGTPNVSGDREALLDKVAEVVPLRATGLKQLIGKVAYAVIFKDDISMNYSPRTGNLKGANLGVVGFQVLAVTPASTGSSGSLPDVRVRILSAEEVVGRAIQTLTSAPAPISSSEPFDVN